MHLKTTLVALSVTGFGLLASSGEAQAAIFTVPGFGQYDITISNTDYDTNSALLQSQPWWGSAANASTFASTVGAGLGLPNFNVFGPFFSYQFSDTSGSLPSYVYDSMTGNVFVTQADAVVTGPYAVATPASTVPEPSELLGTLAFSIISTGYLLQRQSCKVK